MNKLAQKYNEYKICDNFVIGYCSNDKSEFLIDKDDYERVKLHNWYCTLRNSIEARMNNKLIKLHRFVLNYDGDKIIDHKNRNFRDNRKNNLRFVTKSQNQINHTRKGGKTGIVGVHEIKQYNQTYYSVYISINKAYKYCGVFKDKEEAIKRRLQLEYKYYGNEYAPQRHLFEKYNIGSEYD